MIGSGRIASGLSRIKLGNFRSSYRIPPSQIMYLPFQVIITLYGITKIWKLGGLGFDTSAVISNSPCTEKAGCSVI